ncbi:TPA: hypothetical protein ACPT0K_005272, partial [Escherichia coli]
ELEKEDSMSLSFPTYISSGIPSQPSERYRHQSHQFRLSIDVSKCYQISSIVQEDNQITPIS